MQAMEKNRSMGLETDWPPITLMIGVVPWISFISFGAGFALLLLSFVLESARALWGCKTHGSP